MRSYSDIDKQQVFDAFQFLLDFIIIKVGYPSCLSIAKKNRILEPSACLQNQPFS